MKQLSSQPLHQWLFYFRAVLLVMSTQKWFHLEFPFLSGSIALINIYGEVMGKEKCDVPHAERTYILNSDQWVGAGSREALKRRVLHLGNHQGDGKLLVLLSLSREVAWRFA